MVLMLVDDSSLLSSTCSIWKIVFEDARDGRSFMTARTHDNLMILRRIKHQLKSTPPNNPSRTQTRNHERSSITSIFEHNLPNTTGRGQERRVVDQHQRHHHQHQSQFRDFN